MVAIFWCKLLFYILEVCLYTNHFAMQFMKIMKIMKIT